MRLRPFTVAAAPKPAGAISEAYAPRRTVLDKLLAVEPKSIPGLLGKGAVAYNTGDYDSAERFWKAVLAVDAKAVTQKALAQGLSGPALGQALLEAHTQAIAQSRQALSLPNNASPQP